MGWTYLDRGVERELRRYALGFLEREFGDDDINKDQDPSDSDNNMSQLTARRAFYDTPEGQIHYRYLQAPIKDVSKSPILLLHMSATSSAYYEEMIIRLTTAGYDCYAPDMPGFVRLFPSTKPLN